MLRRGLTRRELSALASLAFLVSGCSSSSSGTTRANRPLTRAPNVVELSGGPVVAQRVPLVPLPAVGVRACRRAQATARPPLLCPARLPEPVRSLARNARFSKLVAEPLYPRPNVASGVSFSYGERPLHASWRLRPCCFLHFTIERYETLLLPPFRGRQVTIGGQTGSLARPIPGLFGLYEGHYLFRFRRAGTAYLVTLHGLDSEANSVRVLEALVVSLAPVRSL